MPAFVIDIPLATPFTRARCLTVSCGFFGPAILTQQRASPPTKARKRVGQYVSAYYVTKSVRRSPQEVNKNLYSMFSVLIPTTKYCIIGMMENASSLAINQFLHFSRLIRRDEKKCV